MGGSLFFKFNRIWFLLFRFEYFFNLSVSFITHCFFYSVDIFSLKGGDPAAPSDTATLL